MFGLETMTSLDFKSHEVKFSLAIAHPAISQDNMLVCSGISKVSTDAR